MLKTFSLRDARRAAHRLRAARAARPLRGARADRRQGSPTRSSSSSCAPGDVADARRLRDLRRSPSTHGVPGGRLRARRGASGPAASTTTPPTRSASRSGPSAARCSAASRSRSPTGASCSPRSSSGRARPGRTVVYTGDTASGRGRRACSSRAPTLLIHEATFAERRARARAPRPATRPRSQAAEVARDAGVSLLALTHVSPRYLGLRAPRRGARGLPGDRPAARLRRRSRCRSPSAASRRSCKARRAAGAARAEETPAERDAPGFDGRAARYEELRPVDDNWWEVYEALVRLGELRGSRVLEVGCGTGRLAAGARGARRSRASGRSTRPRRWSSRRSRSASTPGSRRAEALPFKAGWFDAVVMRMSLHLARPAARARAGGARAARRRAGSRSRPRIPPASSDVWFTRFFPSVPAIDGARFPSRDELAAELAAAGLRGGRDRAAPPAPRAHARAARSTSSARRRSRPSTCCRPTSTTRASRAPRPSCPTSFEYHFDWLLAGATR